MLIRALRDAPLLLLIACALLFLAAYFPLNFGDLPGAGAGSYVATLGIALPAFVALGRYLGLRRAAISLIGLSAFAYAVETTGVATGFPYGEFRYGDGLGPKVFGLTPYVLPITYVPLVIGAVAACGSARPGRPRRLAWIAGSAVLLTLIDGVLDPGAVVLGFWEWPSGGPYYGVPLSNYGGWLLSSTIAAALLLVPGRWREWPPLPGLLDGALLAVAFWSGVAAYSGLIFPALLGAGLFLFLLLRRAHLAKAASATPGVTGYKLEGR